MQTAWECRLCPEKTFTRALMSHHLKESHGLPEGLEGDLQTKLHASQNWPDHSENTFGYYDGERLIAVQWRSHERAPDDPMRLGG